MASEGEAMEAVIDRKRLRDEDGEDWVDLVQVGSVHVDAAEMGNGATGEVNDKIEVKRAKKEQDVIAESVQVVMEVEVQESVTNVKSLEILGTEMPGASVMDIEVKKIVESVSIDTVVVENDAGVKEVAEENVKKGTNVPGGGKVGKKRKIAMILAYCGAGYQGMQRNPGAITIEGELEQALFRANAIAACNFGDLRKVDWMRAARTDKGVSAIGQIVSARLVIDPPGFVERVNQHLPKEIRVFGFTRVTSNFNAKQMCDKRRYEYLVPVFAFDPNAHHDRETLLAWTEKRDSIRLQRIERRKALEEKASGSEPGSGAVGAEAAEAKDTRNGSLLPAVSEGQPQATGISLVETNGVTEIETFHTPELDLNVEVESCEESTMVVEEIQEAEVEASANSEEQVPFVFGEAQLKRLNGVLSRYCGTYNFHNFTARIKPEDPSAKRYILSFQAGEIIEVNGMQFVPCTVVGQSFMLHQIRKMIGTAIAIMRGCVPESIIDFALKRENDVNTPMAPELGLFLDECFYTAYNKKFRHTHEEITQKGFEQDILMFKHEVIYPHIATTEAKDGTMALWLHCLNDRSYPYFVTARESLKA